ncbi:MAG: cytidylate kinase [Candidatus Marinimicrobia bacterium]|nr:cytidylate kinase [Candidatus Neomarinimicrobiota bacterium]
MIIAIDGPSASGKSTTAKEVAKRLSIMHLDTGAMYRAVTWGIKQSSINIYDDNAIKNYLYNIELYFDENNHIYLNNRNVSDVIRTVDISEQVSIISARPEVRKKMVEIQRKLGREFSCVLEGRDIGTVVFPNAEFKFFLNADVDIRAKRRFSELKKKNEKITFDEILKNIKNRDRMDSSRVHSPLKKAKDAIEIDTTQLTINDQVDKILERIKNK